mmetsp:Transcript_1702/g.2727  ORF Transcript_1702/g.2727 Transcript_1702/m.2727 type:complete len:87 (+) Transcript_1702:63-323(+)
MNLTLCRQRSVRDVVATMPLLDEQKRARVLADLEPHMQYFFASPGPHKSRGVPRQLRVAALLRAPSDEVAVVTFSVPPHFDFHDAA